MGGGNMKVRARVIWGVIRTIIQLLAPLFAALITCVFPSSKTLDPIQKVAIITAGIAIPIALMQTSISLGHLQSEKGIQDLRSSSENNKNALCNSIDDVADKINHMSPVLEKVFLSGNDRITRFAYRRLGEVYRTIQVAVNSGRSDMLKPSEYYDELLYLADLIQNDKALHKESFTGEIWAMTGFAPDEWVAEVGLEQLWSSRLLEMAMDGIPTRRLCLLSDELYSIITSPDFKDKSGESKSFDSFVKFLSDYYTRGNQYTSVEQYIIKENENPDLRKIKGFFAIKLTNGELYILSGETVYPDSLTAQVIFDSKEIQSIRNKFELYARESNRIERKIKVLTEKNNFMSFLSCKNIELTSRTLE